MSTKVSLLALLIIFCSCRDKEENSFEYCNDLLSNCAGNGSGQYCTLGFKWGGNNPFSGAGLEAEGPQKAGGEVTYSFQEAGVVFNTHSQTAVVSGAFRDLTSCGDSRKQIRNTLEAWSAVADITFVEANNPNTSDITFIAANIEQGGLGYPAYTDDLCSTIAGQVIFDIPTRNSCAGFYNLALHEIGHVMGLGHVASRNIMNDKINDLFELQSGDIAGAQSIYGEE